MSILIIGKMENVFVQNLRNELENLKEEIVIISEIGRCITPLDKKERAKIDEQGQRGQILAQQARRVYLVRGEKVERIK